VVSALDREDLGALVPLVDPGERTALVRLAGAWSGRLAELDLPDAVGGGASVPSSHVLDGLTLDVTGATPREESRAGGIAVVGLGALRVRVRTDPAAAHGLLRAWFAHQRADEARDLTYDADHLPAVGSLPRLVTVERSGRWYLSVLGTLLGPGEGAPLRVQTLVPTSFPTAQAAVGATVRALLDNLVRPDVSVLAQTLDPSGSDTVQLWAAQIPLVGLDHPPQPVEALRTSDGPVSGSRAVVHVETLRVGDGSQLDLDGRCVRSGQDRACLHPSGYRYTGGLGSLSLLELLGPRGAFSLTAVRDPGGWRTNIPESLADAFSGYADGLTREQVLMVLGQERFDTPAGVLAADQPKDVAFTSAGYALRTVPIEQAGLYRVVASPTGSNRASLFGPDGQPAIQPFFPNDSVYRLTPGEHTLLVWADDAFARRLEQDGGAPYVQRVEVRSVR
jgi:hypothetical protein